MLRAAATVVAMLGLLWQAPAAHAGGTVTVGMEITIGNHSCSLRFFATDDNRDRLAVTAGHCADNTDDVEPVFLHNGTEIGQVVSHVADSDSRRSVRPRGYTLIRIYNQFAVQPFFTDIADAHIGDAITKFGARSGKTTGHITDTHYTNGSDPANETLLGDVVILPGDSGCPWYTSGPTLVGISASGNNDRGGGDDEGSQAQPVWSVIHLIRQHSAKFGPGFKVWIDK